MTAASPFGWPLVLTLALFGWTGSARAEVQVTGPADALRITAHGDKLADVLSSVSSHLRLKYRTAVDLDAPTSGTYSGSLGQVMSRLLDRYNYVIKQNGGEREIIVLGKRGEAAIAAPAPPPAPMPARAPVAAPGAGAPSIASRWR